MRLILFGGKERYDSELRVAIIRVKRGTARDEHRNAQYPEGRHGEGSIHAQRSPYVPFQPHTLPEAQKYPQITRTRKP
jgi:hypothetical protein